MFDEVLSPFHLHALRVYVPAVVCSGLLVAALTLSGLCECIDRDLTRNLSHRPHRKLALRKSKCSLCCQFIFPIGMMALAIVLKMAVSCLCRRHCKQYLASDTVHQTDSHRHSHSSPPHTMSTASDQHGPRNVRRHRHPFAAHLPFGRCVHTDLRCRAPVRKCTPADRANPNNDCEFLAFDPFVAAYGQGNGGLWFSSASNQCQPGGVTMFYAPQGNPAVQAVMQQAAQLAETRTGLNGPNFAFTARGVRSESDIPASFLAYPSDACSFFVDFTETCGETDTASCAPWHYVVRPPFVPGG